MGTNEISHYVVSNRLAGDPQSRILAEDWSRSLFERTLRHFASIYTVRVLCLAIGDAGFQIRLEVDRRQRLSHAELERRQGRLDGRKRTPLTKKEARRLRQRLGSLSDFMRDVQSVWTRRYNRCVQRRGPMWAERFHSVLLGSWGAMRAAELFVRKRAGVVRLAEADSGWDRSWRREEVEMVDRLWLRRHWRELVPVWEWGRVVGDRRFVERCAARDRGCLRWEAAELGMAGLWSLRPPARRRRTQPAAAACS